jgi:abortive infection Abi-like protein
VVLNACSSILDALNPVRNRASVAHPNEELLGRDEAQLVINVGRSLLSYLDGKLAAEEGRAPSRTPRSLSHIPADPSVDRASTED